MKYIREEGKIYFAESKKEGGYNYIFKSNATDGHNDYIVLSSNGASFTKISNKSSFSWDLEWNVREATELEKQWLELSIKANKLVPKPEFTEDNYEIY